MLYNYVQLCIIMYLMHNHAVFTIGFVLSMHINTDFCIIMRNSSELCTSTHNYYKPYSKCCIIMSHCV